MHERSLLTRIPLLLSLIAITVALCGCGAAGDPMGQLRVENSALSSESIVRVRIVKGLDVDDINVTIDPNQFWQIGLEPGLYDVQLSWSDFSVDNFFAVVIADGLITPILGQQP